MTTVIVFVGCLHLGTLCLAVFEALGDVDELNACIGVARAHCEAANSLKALDEQLASVQSRLLDVGSGVATPLDSATPEQLERAQFDDDHVTVLEQWIDGMDDTLPVLRAFILPVSHSKWFGHLAGGRAAHQLLPRHTTQHHSLVAWQPHICIMQGQCAAGPRGVSRSLLTGSRPPRSSPSSSTGTHQTVGDNLRHNTDPCCPYTFHTG